MNTKRAVTLVAFLVFMMAGFLLYFVIYTRQPQIQGREITGRDEHGCLIGYEWNETGFSCIKINIDGNVTYQVVDFQTCSDAGYAIDENNSTGLLQCHALNGTIFTQNSTAIALVNNSNITNYPNDITLVGNFTITNNINSTNGTNSINSTGNT